MKSRVRGRGTGLISDPESGIHGPPPAAASPATEVSPVRSISPAPAMSERAAAEIRDAILAGALAPGSPVRQEDLATRLGVSREPVRQALRVLEREGLVRTLPNRRAIVAPVDRALIVDIYELREAIEALVAAKLARGPHVEAAPLRALVAEGRAAVRRADVDRLIDLDLAFHTSLYEAAGNHVIAEIMRQQWRHIRRVMGATLAVSGYRRHVWDEHAAILEAIAARDERRARDLAAAHTRAARELLTARLDGRDPTAATGGRAR